MSGGSLRERSPRKMRSVSPHAKAVITTPCYRIAVICQGRAALRAATRSGALLLSTLRGAATADGSLPSGHQLDPLWFRSALGAANPGRPSGPQSLDVFQLHSQGRFVE